MWFGLAGCSFLLCEASGVLWHARAHRDTHRHQVCVDALVLCVLCCVVCVCVCVCVLCCVCVHVHDRFA